MIIGNLKSAKLFLLGVLCWLENILFGSFCVNKILKREEEKKEEKTVV